VKNFTKVFISILLFSLAIGCSKESEKLSDEYKQALALFQSKQLPEASQAFRRLYEENPDYLLVRLMLAKSYFLSNKLKEALSLFEEDFAENPKRLESAVWMYRTRFVMGEDLGEVAKGLDEVISNDSNDVEAWILRGRIYEVLGRKDLAIESYRNVVKHEERLGLAYFRLSELLFHGDNRDGKEELTKARTFGFKGKPERRTEETDGTKIKGKK